MGFTPKDWRNATTHEGGGDETTPISAVSLEDIETRLSDYTDDHAPAFSVRDYGAVADGSTDNATTLQAAITAAAGGILYIPAGTSYYKTNGTLTMPSNTTILAERGAEIRAGAALGYLMRNSDATNGNSDIVVEGLELNGGGYVTSSIFDVRGTACASVHLVRCHLHNTDQDSGSGVGVHIDNCSDVRILDCEVNNTYRDGIQVFEGSENVQVRGNWVYDTGDDCISFCGNDAASAIPTGITCTENIVEPRDPPTIAASGISIGSAQGVSCIGNVITGACSIAGIKVTNWWTGAAKDVVVANNVIRNSDGLGIGVGIDVNVSGTGGGCQRIKVCDNVIFDPDEHGIHIHAKTTIGGIHDVLVSGNSITYDQTVAHYANAHGIFVWQESNSVTGILVRGNRVDEAPQYGILVSDADSRVDVVGNHVTNSGDQTAGMGILLTTAGEKFLIADNMCTDTQTGSETQTYGYQQQGGPTKVRVHNNDFTGNLTGNVNFVTGGTGTVVAAATTTLPDFPDVITVTGTTSITSVTASLPSRQVTLIFTDANPGTFTDGGNLRISGNFDPNQYGAITLVCDGTNWYEVGRSAN